MMPFCSEKHHPNHEIVATFDFNLDPHHCFEFEFNAVLPTGGAGVEQKREQKGEELPLKITKSPKLKKCRNKNYK